MTREELIAGLTEWNPPVGRWGLEVYRHRDALQFALWWYGSSTEADKADPSWPEADYVASKIGGGLSYLTSIDAALTLMPAGVWLDIRTGTQKRVKSFEWPVIEYGDQQSGHSFGQVQARSIPVTLCLIAIGARLRTNVVAAA